MNYAAHVSKRVTPQSSPIPGSDQVQNNAGGYAWKISEWDRLDRFLILGSEGNTFYCTEREMTLQNATCISSCLKADAAKTIDRVIEISVSGRAPKNDPAIFALAIASCDPNCSDMALRALPLVCRTGTHLFQFVSAVDAMRGWGRRLQRGICEWYLDKKPDDLAYQLLKYQSRNGWSHKDVMHLCHLRSSKDSPHYALQWWVERGWEGIGAEAPAEKHLKRIWAFEKLKADKSVKTAVSLIEQYGLDREMIPTELLNDKLVWAALLQRMPATALIRNLATMTRIGLLAPLSEAEHFICFKLRNAEWLKKSRVHPIAVLIAAMTYAAGRSIRGENTWIPLQSVINALNDAFYLSFGSVTPTGKRWLLAIDVSGSMDGGMIAGVPGLNPRIAAAAMSLVTAKTEERHHVVAFTAEGGRWSLSNESAVTPLGISPHQRLDDVVQIMKSESIKMGATDCALPMLYAEKEKLPVDVFAVYTDNETWAGQIHPSQALEQYRQKMGINAKAIAVGMTATEYSVFNSDDAGSLNVVGFDAAAPELMSQFAVA